MHFINKISSAEAIDFAALELKKYLRMMMPEGGDVKISYAPEAKEGFRLGLMQDFGLDVSDAENCELDDIIYIDCDAYGGIIAGDNPRSVLFAVYEYLKHNGCRWLYPGVDGEYIPIKDIAPVKYRHKPFLRYRGYAAEGAVYQDAVLSFIDFMPKLGLNTYMIEFRIPRSYYEFYYKHFRNAKNRPEEPITDEQVVQWKRQTETEIAKRGLQFHDIGHGWTVDPFGIDAKYAWEKIDDSLVPADAFKHLALLNGKRALYGGRPACTQFCMSSVEARTLVVDFIVRYAKEHSNIDYLHVWLADDANNHCECEECSKKTPSDYYVVLMNELDTALNKAELDTRIVFIAYLDTVYPPEIDKVDNPDRFALMIAPISRDYARTRPDTPRTDTVRKYERNKVKSPGALSDNLDYLDEWQKHFGGAAISFEYHFWRHLYYDMTGLQMARRLYEDVRYYAERGVKGIIEDGTLRGFFPNGIALYTYATAMYDENISFEEIRNEYFSYIYGEDYIRFIEYFDKINEVFPYAEMTTNSPDGGMKKMLEASPERVAAMDRIVEILDEGKKLVAEHYDSEMRVRTVSARLLEWHIKYIEGIAPVIREKLVGNDDESMRAFEQFQFEFGKNEPYIQPYFDHLLNFSGLMHLFRIRSNPLITE